MKDYREMAESVLQRRDAYVIEKKRRQKQFRKVCGAVCSLALVAFLSVNALLVQQGEKASFRLADRAGLGSDGAVNDALPQESEMMQYAVVEDLREEMAVEEETGQDTAKEQMAKATLDGQLADGSEQEFKQQATEADAVCIGAMEANYEADPMEQVWGGSYLNDQGKHVVFLTQNNETYQNMVFELNPDWLEENTIFRDAAFSLNYLNEVLDLISKDMVAGKLPYVPSAYVNEYENCVTVRTIDLTAGQQAELLGYGLEGSIVIVSGEELSTTELLQEKE